MSHNQQLELSKTPLGRIKLHILTLVRDHKIKFHIAGIKRELTA